MEEKNIVSDERKKEIKKDGIKVLVTILIVYGCLVVFTIIFTIVGVASFLKAFVGNTSKYNYDYDYDDDYYYDYDDDDDDYDYEDDIEDYFDAFGNRLSEYFDSYDANKDYYSNSLNDYYNSKKNEVTNAITDSVDRFGEYYNNTKQNLLNENVF